MLNLTFVILCLSVCVGKISCSAIPMWEYLSKDEKMSYLYSMFSNQVEEFCEFSEMKNCNQELLKFGLKKLKGMPEDHLDIMDPYQRGANTIIWDSMMEGHDMMKTTSTTTTKPNSYEDGSFKEENFRLQASASIGNVYRVPPPKGFTYVAPQYTISTGIPQYKYPNSINYIDNQQLTRRTSYEEAPLTGPMVVKVYPDGTPVHDSKSQLPHDEDLKHHKMTKVKLPTL